MRNQSFFVCLLVFNLFLSASLTAFADTKTPSKSNPIVVELRPYEADYKARIKNKISMTGEAKRSLKKRSDGNWVYNFQVEALAADAKEFSVFEFSNNSIRSLQYDYRLEGFLIRNKKRTAFFDWDKQQANGEYKKKNWQHPISDTLDPLAFQLQLSIDLLQGKTEMNREVINKGKLEQVKFARIGEESIQTKWGKQDAIVVKKIRENAKRVTKLWFSKEDPMKLLRFEQKETDGEEYVIELQRFEYKG